MDRSLHRNKKTTLTFDKLNHIKRYKIASIFIIIILAIAITAFSYLSFQRYHTSIPYTELVEEIIEAKTTPAWQPYTFEDSNSEIELISGAISTSVYSLHKIQNMLAEFHPLKKNTGYTAELFSKTEDSLLDLQVMLSSSEQESSDFGLLQYSTSEVQANLTRLYETLTDEIKRTEHQQYFFIKRFHIIATVAFALITSSALYLLFSVIHLKHQRNIMRNLMLTDELTGLYNRRHLVDAAYVALYKTKRDKTPLSVLLLDLDYFKHINDSYGHPVGDKVLKKISECLRQFSRPSDTLGRIGGEEFCLLMPSTNTHDALQAADRLRRAVEDLTYEGLPLKSSPTISIGVTACYREQLSFEELYSYADKALYQAKAMGRNRVESILPLTETTSESTKRGYSPLPSIPYIARQ
nr:GGDEF domain-containing protein [uncultured Halomonas sp.]